MSTMLAAAPARRLAAGSHAARPVVGRLVAPTAVQARSLAASRTPEQKYERKSPLDHVLLRPGMYIGSTHAEEHETWVLRDGRMQQCRVLVPQGLLKIFDEILVNAADNRQRDPSMSYIRITADRGTVSVENNGTTIPVQLHETEGMYVPELVFGHLLTGSNFDDETARLTGGRHGYGAKLTNIFSSSFAVEAADTERRKQYRQSWADNMRTRHEPQVSALRGKRAQSFTRVTFSPDMSRFGGVEDLSDDVLAAMQRRALDVAACNPGLEVTWNGETLPVRGFEDYVRLFSSPGQEEAEASAAIAVSGGDRWRLAVLPSPTGQFEQVSFVNSMHTPRGGTHVQHAVEPLVQHVTEALQKRHPALGVTRAMVRQRMMVLVSAMVENPEFNSQAKEQLTSRPGAFGSACQVPASTLKKLATHQPLVAPIVADAKGRQHAELLRATRSKRGSRISLLDVPKLEDANDAGGRNGGDCTLILTEGDSAKALAVAGLAVVGRDRYGVFPLRGKPLNVREASPVQVRRNQEITNLIRVLGLDFSRTYEGEEGKGAGGARPRPLRYGRILIMTDQDYDGSHIKGLVLNLFHHFFPALLHRPGFLAEFVTPVLKARRGREVKEFFTVQEFEAWHAALPAGERHLWRSKYYKGLGTSTAEEGREYFRDLDRHILSFTCGSKQEAALLDMAFSKKRAADRKRWLTNQYDPAAVVDHSASTLSVGDFVNRELIHFSYADTVRSIPSLVDGLKPAQRKVLYACLQRDVKSEMKVAQLAGFVAERTAYHHGEASLHATIVNMAQDFVGANNLPLLAPVGQFGTRLQGGRDAASPRYIFTRLSPLARFVFRPEDACALRHRVDDGQVVEPVTFFPVLPMALVNGSEGIGTGWSTFLPPHHPVHVLDATLAHVRAGGDARAAGRGRRLRPWVRGFTGNVVRASGRGAAGWRTRGLYSVRDAPAGRAGCVEVDVTELPVGRWTEDYRAHLSRMAAEDGPLQSFSEYHTEHDVRFVLQFDAAAGAELVRSEKELIRALKLETSFSTSNMHLFDADGRIRRYNTAEAVMKEFFPARRAMYDRRRAIRDAQLEARAARLRNQAQFVQDVCTGAVSLVDTPRDSLLALLSERGFDAEEAFATESASVAAAKLDGQVPTGEEAMAVEGAVVAAEEGDKAEPPSPNGGSASGGSGFDYLLRLPLASLTRERQQNMLAQGEGADAELARLRETSALTMWESELLELRTSLLEDPLYARDVEGA